MQIGPIMLALSSDLPLKKLLKALYYSPVLLYNVQTSIVGVSEKGGHVPFQIFHFLKIRIDGFNHVNNAVTISKLQNLNIHGNLKPFFSK